MKEITLTNGKKIHIYDSAEDMPAWKFVKFSKAVLLDAIAGSGSIGGNIANALSLMNTLVLRDKELLEKTLSTVKKMLLTHTKRAE